MRDHKLTIAAGEQIDRSAPISAWYVRACSVDDVVRLDTESGGGLLLHTGQTVDMDFAEPSFKLVNTGTEDVTLHLQTAEKAVIGSKKNSAETGGAGVDQAARDAAAGAQSSADANAAKIEEIQSTEPFAQSLIDSGRFTAVAETGTPVVYTAASGVLMPVLAGNASEVASSKYIYGNSTNGGPNGALDQSVIDFLDALGRIGSAATYGTEFYILHRQIDALPSVPVVIQAGGLDYFLAQGWQALTGFDGYLTCAYWIYCAAGEVLIKSAESIIVDGGAASVGVSVVLGAGWHHVQRQTKTNYGYTEAEGIYGVSGASYSIALPVVSRSKTTIPQHTAPVIYT